MGLNNSELTIYKGRPGGLLWFHPTIVERTGVPATAVLQSRLSDLQSGKVEPSLSQAQAYVASLKQEEDRQLQESQSVATTTVPPGNSATTVPGAPTTLPAP